MPRRRRRGSWALLAIALLFAGSGFVVWRARERNSSLLNQSVQLLQIRPEHGRPTGYAGRISPTDILLIERGDTSRPSAVVYDTRTRLSRPLAGLTTLLRRRRSELRGVPARPEMQLIGSPRGDRVIWVCGRAAGLCDLDGRHEQRFRAESVTAKRGPPDTLDALWSPDGSGWALVSYGHGMDGSFADGITLGKATSTSPAAVMRSGSRPFRRPGGWLVLRPHALTLRGLLVATDGDRGAFVVDPAKQTATPFILDGLEHAACDVRYAATVDGRLVWVSSVHPDGDPPEAVHWLRDRLDTWPPTMVYLRVNRFDGARGRQIGALAVHGPMSAPKLLGVSPDGKWADFEYEGSLYTIRIPR